MKMRVVLMFLASVLMLSSASAQDTGTITHARGVVNIQQNQNYFVTLKWAVPFADTKYTVSCSPIASSSFQNPGTGVYLFQIVHISPEVVKVELAAEGGTGPIRIDCIALHD